MTGADVEHSAQIKIHGVILHAIDATRRREPRVRVVAAYELHRSRPPPPKKKTAQEKRRDPRPPARLRQVPADVHGLPLPAVLLCASCCCRSWVAKGRKEEEHAKAKKHRERRAKAEAEAKAEAVLAEQPNLAEPLGDNATT